MKKIYILPLTCTALFFAGCDWSSWCECVSKKTTSKTAVHHEETHDTTEVHHATKEAHKAAKAAHVEAKEAHEAAQKAVEKTKEAHEKVAKTHTDDNPMMDAVAKAKEAKPKEAKPAPAKKAPAEPKAAEENPMLAAMAKAAGKS